VAAIDTGTDYVSIRTHGDQRQTCQRQTIITFVVNRAS
jgi:hypothetical protein